VVSLAAYLFQRLLLQYFCVIFVISLDFTDDFSVLFFVPNGELVMYANEVTPAHRAMQR